MRLMACRACGGIWPEANASVKERIPCARCKAMDWAVLDEQILDKEFTFGQCSRCGILIMAQQRRLRVQAFGTCIACGTGKFKKRNARQVHAGPDGEGCLVWQPPPPPVTGLVISGPGRGIISHCRFDGFSRGVLVDGADLTTNKTDFTNTKTAIAGQNGAKLRGNFKHDPGTKS